MLMFMFLGEYRAIYEKLPPCILSNKELAYLYSGFNNTSLASQNPYRIALALYCIVSGKRSKRLRRKKSAHADLIPRLCFRLGTAI